ncbi:hypothetical protein [Chryseobacterium sp. CH21]|uniref:hypothetical protein n=1 Tax=Chryseobacterium sp. CH21 TaxID=713556 RepID=UPI0013E996B3|nr:hypothetical protein [Chryseobacterium sp. CH21]
MSSAEEQLTSNTINAVNNNLEGWFFHPFSLIIGTALWLKKPFTVFHFYKKDTIG